MKKILKILPGFFLCWALVVLSKVASLSFPSLGKATLCILLGLLVGNTLGEWRLFRRVSFEGVQFCEKKLLNVAVVLMGFSLDGKALLSLGWIPLVAIVGGVVLALSLSLWLGRVMKMSREYALLIGMGSAICGSQAVAAASTVLFKHRSKSAGQAVTLVNLWGTAGLLLLPWILSQLNFSVPAEAVLVGGSLQSLGHVVAAGAQLGAEVGDLSLLIKMGRIFLLIPTLLIAKFLYSKKNEGPEGGSWASFLPMPMYSFLGAVLVGNLGLLPESFVVSSQMLASLSLLFALAGIGLNIHIKDFLHQGGRALSLSGLVFLAMLLYFAAFTLIL